MDVIFDSDGQKHIITCLGDCDKTPFTEKQKSQNKVFRKRGSDQKFARIVKISLYVFFFQITASAENYSAIKTSI